MRPNYDPVYWGQSISLTIFAVFYGFDWIATVPPAVTLANQSFGERDGPIIYGWVLVAHQMGAAVAAFGAGVIREETATYTPAFLIAGAFAVVVALISVFGSNLHKTPQADSSSEVAA